MSKQTRWLLSEVDRWTTERIVTAEQAVRIRALYRQPAAELSWGLIVFFGLGAVIVGLGIILLFAYNWDEIPKFGKLALIFAAMLSAHAGGLQLRKRDDWRRQLGEALSLLGTMAFGAGIWLVAQIYHIDEHFPNGFLIWAIGALAMAWVLESVPQAALATVLFAFWAAAEAWGFGSPVDAAPLIVAAGVGPLVWRRRSALLLAIAIAALYWLTLINGAHWGGSATLFGSAFALSVLMIAMTKFTGGSEFGGNVRRVLLFFGWSGFVLCSYILTFEGAVREVLDGSAAPHAVIAAFVYRWLLFVIAMGGWAWLLLRVRRGAHGLVSREEWLCPVALVYAQALTIFTRGDESLVSAVFSLVCLALAAAWMVRGCREGRLRPTVIGSLLLSAVILARFFDLFDSLAMRGVAFLVLGLVLFAEGFYYRKLRRTEAEPLP